MSDELLDKVRRYNLLFMEREHRRLMGVRLTLAEMPDDALFEELYGLKMEIDATFKRKAEGAGA